jgi:two-component system chemotaxis sensor kinase CheA
MDELNSKELDQLFAIFRDQSLQILEEMIHDLLAVESGAADGEAMARLRRGAHTIKGDSACIGLEGVTQVAHKIEDLFDAVQTGQLVVDRRAVDVILKGLDLIKDAINGEQVSDVPEDSASVTVEQLTRIVETDESALLPTDRNVEALQQRDEPVRNEPGVTTRNRRDYVRVEATKLDTLLNLAGEMVIARSVISQLGPEFEHTLGRSEMFDRFSHASSHLGKLTAELQKNVLKMRMITIDHVFRRFIRPMRDLAAEHGKEIELQIAGSETELDRALVDALYEPLLHLLRNAVAHGIERPAERQGAGKPASGRISMRAYHEGNQVVIEVSDDGRGIDPVAVKAQALRSGAVTEQQAAQMADEDAIELIFLQGLSTAKELTPLSGRGVGTAAVKSAIEHLRGSVAVKSEVGGGTCFVLRMPLTLAIIKALLFTAAGQLFALPLLAISEIARAVSSDVVHLNGIEHYRLRDRFVSLVRPGAVLAFDRRRGGNGAVLRSEAVRFFIIVLAAGNKRYGVVADELIGEQELVIKPLDTSWVQNDAVGGASVLGDGRVVLIMDAEMVFRKAIKHERAKSNDREAYAV